MQFQYYIKLKRKERKHSMLVLKGGHSFAIGVTFDFPVWQKCD